MYHNAVRLIKKNEEILRDASLAKAMSGLEHNQFWREIKRLKDARKPVASAIDGHKSQAEICDVFTEKYSALYNSVPYNSDDMMEFLGEIDDLLEDSNAVLLISTADITRAIRTLKKGKNDGKEGHMTHSDHFINGTPLLYSKMAQLFTAMITHGFAPESFLLGTLSPIVKNPRKSINSSSNYRGITLSSILGKILDRIIMQKYKGFLYSSDQQYGFKKAHSTVQCTLIIDEVSKHFVSNHGEMYILLLDASQAFDRVNYVKLFRLLKDRGMCPLLCRFLVFSYTQQKVRIKWSDSISDPFTVKNGVKQGGVLSPTLFNVYVDSMLDRLTARNIGCHIQGRFCGAVSYADDLTLLAPTLHALQLMLNEIEAVALDLDVKFNGSKSQLVSYNRHGHIHTSVPCMGEVINSIPNAIHLGNPVGIEADSLRVKRSIRDMIIQCNCLCTLFPHVNIDVKYRLFKSYCMPLYGCQLWRLNSSNINLIHVCWRKCLRRLLNLPQRTHCNLIHVICQDVPFIFQILNRFAKFVRSLSKSVNLCTRLCLISAISGSCSVLSQNIIYLCSVLGISKYDIPQTNISLGASASYADFAVDDATQHLGGLIRDLVRLRDRGGSDLIRNGWTANEFNVFLNHLCCS